MSLFDELMAIDCRDHIEKKGKFSYLSWSWAWATLKRHCPEARVEKHLFEGECGKRPYMTDAQGLAYVQVTVYVESDSQTEVFPVLNHSNKPIQNPNSFDVNTALQRCMVKAIAMLGLGLYIYSGEDVPEGAEPLVAMENKSEQAKNDLKELF